MAEGKKSFIAYADWKDTFEALPDDKAGILIKHIFKYVADEDPKSDDVLINAVFANIRNTLKRDLKRWDKQYTQRVEAGKKSAEVRKRNATSVNERSISSTVSDSVSVSVNGSVNESVILKDNSTNVLVKKVFTSYNIFAEKYSIPKVKKETDARKKLVKARLKNEYDLKTVFEKIGQSDFLLSGGFISFDWIFKQTNFNKILEGNYDNTRQKQFENKKTTKPEMLTDKMEREWSQKTSL